MRVHGMRVHGMRVHGMRVHGMRVHGIRVHGMRVHGMRVQRASYMLDYKRLVENKWCRGQATCHIVKGLLITSQRPAPHHEPSLKSSVIRALHKRVKRS